MRRYAESRAAAADARQTVALAIARLAYVCMPAAVVMAFLWAPAAEILGESSRILYFHVPVAWVAVLAFLVSGVAAGIYLADKKKAYRLLEEKFHNSAEIGMVFCVLATVTGSIWARLMWGSYWNWDPRETSIVILLLIYTAYFSLRAALAGNPNRGRISASYLVFAMTTMPFFVFVVPRIYPSLHPDPIINPAMKLHLDGDMRLTLLVSVIAFTLLYFYIFILKNRVSGLRIRIEEASHEE